MTALLQLSYAPLNKPNTESGETSKNTKNCDQVEFRMTVKRYQELLADQKEFYIRLISLLSNCPQYECIRVLMMIHGQTKRNWLFTCTRKILVSKIIQPGGVLSLIIAICGNDLDTGENWRALDMVSKLLAVSHGKDLDEYYRLVCPQVCVYVLKLKYIKYIA